ncbi:hypothetical protein Dimus_026249 [Dionaea muscipula]
MGRRGRPPKHAVVQVAVSDLTELGNDLGLHEVAIEDEDSRGNSVIEVSSQIVGSEQDKKGKSPDFQGLKAGREKWVMGGEECAEIAGNEEDDGDKNLKNRRETESRPAVVESREKEEAGISAMCRRDTLNQTNRRMDGLKAGGEKWVMVSRGAKKQVMQEGKQRMARSSDTRFHVLQGGEEECAEIAGNEEDDGDKNLRNRRETESRPVKSRVSGRKRRPNLV